MAVKRNLESVKHEVETILQGTFIIDWSGYKNTHSVVSAKCAKCGTIKKVKINHILVRKSLSCDYCKQRDIIDNFVHKSKVAHNYQYVYPDIYSEYINNSTHITAICPLHGAFAVTPTLHMYGQMKCPKCNPNYKPYHKPSQPSKAKLEFKEKVYKIHGNAINVDDVEYVKAIAPIKAYCNVCHKYFTTTAHDLLRGHGCRTCAIKRQSLSRAINVDEYIKQAQKLHPTYIYDEHLGYKSLKDSIYPICPIHGRFECNAWGHLKGYGICPQCNRNRTNVEMRLYQMVKNICPDAIHHYQDIKIMGRQHLDIYIPLLQIGIEYQGLQHFKPIPFYGGQKAFEKIVANDLKKIEKCDILGIKLLHVSFDKVPKDFDKYHVITTFAELKTLLS